MYGCYTPGWSSGYDVSFTSKRSPVRPRFWVFTGKLCFGHGFNCGSGSRAHEPESRTSPRFSRMDQSVAEDKSTKATNYHIFTNRWDEAIVYDGNPASIPGVLWVAAGGPWFIGYRPEGPHTLQLQDGRAPSPARSRRLRRAESRFAGSQRCLRRRHGASGRARRVLHAMAALPPRLFRMGLRGPS